MVVFSFWEVRERESEYVLYSRVDIHRRLGRERVSMYFTVGLTYTSLCCINHFCLVCMISATQLPFLDYKLSYRYLVGVLFYKL